MSGLITKSRVFNISENSLHFTNGNLFLVGIENVRKENKIFDATNEDLTSFHHLYLDHATNPVDLFSQEYFVGEQTTERTTQKMEIIFDVDNFSSQSLSNLKLLLDVCGNLFFSPNRTKDYIQPATDTPIVDFLGHYDFQAKNTKFVVSTILQIGEEIIIDNQGNPFEQENLISATPRYLGGVQNFNQTIDGNNYLIPVNYNFMPEEFGTVFINHSMNTVNSETENSYIMFQVNGSGWQLMDREQSISIDKAPMVQVELLYLGYQNSIIQTFGSNTPNFNVN